MRYDAAIIGAGADGLAAAATLAESGLKVIVLERNEQPGGRCATREFHPGFHASAFCDALPPVPAEMFWSLDLGRRGAIFVPDPVSTALWPDRAYTIRRSQSALFTAGNRLAEQALHRSQADVAAKATGWFASRRSETAQPWPGEELAKRSLSDHLAAAMIPRDAMALVMAGALAGRAFQPDHAGSALHMIATGAGMTAGGLHRLGDALGAAAEDAGAEISCGLEVTDIRRRNGKIIGLGLADGTEVAARAVISTLDLKRTFLSLFAWNDLPKPVANRVATFRMAGSTARLLFALDGPPVRPGFAEADLFQGPVFVAPLPQDFADAYAAWRSGTLAERLPVTLRFNADPRLCPLGKATMAATVGCVPARLFDGAWTNEKRAALRDRVLMSIETVLPGVSARVLATDVITPPDIEEALGCTDGDLWGGEIAPDQMLGFRPWLDSAGQRTQIEGLYLAGGSTVAGVLGTCAAGVYAAGAVMADLKAERLK